MKQETLLYLIRIVVSFFAFLLEIYLIVKSLSSNLIPVLFCRLMTRKKGRRKFLSSRRNPEDGANHKNKDPPSILILVLHWNQTRYVIVEMRGRVTPSLNNKMLR